MLVKSSEGSPGSSVFLDGSFSWRDYLFQAQVRGQVGKNVGLIARYIDRSNFVTCIYSGNSVRIDQRLNDEVTTLAKRTLWRSFEDSEADLGIKVAGSDVSCLIGDTKIVEAHDLSPNLNRGGIGIRSFDSDLNRSQVNVGSVQVEPIQASEPAWHHAMRIGILRIRSRLGISGGKFCLHQSGCKSTKLIPAPLMEKKQLTSHLTPGISTSPMP